MISDIPTVFRQIFRQYAAALVRDFRHSDCKNAKDHRARMRPRVCVYLCCFYCLTV